MRQFFAKPYLSSGTYVYTGYRENPPPPGQEAQHFQQIVYVAQKYIWIDTLDFSSNMNYHMRLFQLMKDYSAFINFMEWFFANIFVTICHPSSKCNGQSPITMCSVVLELFKENNSVKLVNALYFV